jgi:4'-phosphopantetheinyl transferase EntD
MSDWEHESLFAPLLSRDTVIVESQVSLVDDQLWPEELACVQRAVSKRRAEFGTGRLCARRALAQLGLPSRPLLTGLAGAPQWPDGTIGSITHTAEYCAAVVKRSPPWRGVGIDAEDVRILEEDVIRAISTERERLWLAGLAPEIRHAHAVLLFSAKEAFYKLQRPLTGLFLDFPEVEIEIDSRSDHFRASTRARVPKELADICGRFRFAGGRVLCALELS